MTNARTRTALFLVLALPAFAACKKDAKPDTQTTSATATVDKPKEPEGATFVKKAPAVGSKVDEKSTTKMDLSMTVDPGTGKPQSQQMQNVETENKLEEVLAVGADGAITKVKVTYEDKSTTENGKPHKNALSGKTFIVESKDGKLVVSDDKGKAAPSNDATSVSKSYKSLGKPDPVLSALPTRPLKDGESVPELAKAIEDEMKQDAPDMNVSNVSVKFKNKTGDDGVFDVTATLGAAQGPVKFSIALAGDMHVRTADGQLSSMKLNGPVTVGPNDDPSAKGPKGLKVDGKGTMEMSTERTSK